MDFLAGIVAIAALGALLYLHGLQHEPEGPERPRLAGPDDQDLDLAAALRPGPLPSYSEERDELEARRCR